MKENVFFLNDSCQFKVYFHNTGTGLCRVVLLQYKIKVLSTVIRKCYRGKKLDYFFFFNTGT